MMNIIRSVALGGLALTLAGGIASAQTMPGMDHSGHMQQPAAAGAASPSTEAFEQANARMHEGMAIEFSGDTDVDFAKGMIPHHQGAIDMAKIELQYGKDPELRKLAEDIIKAQESEIAFLKAWLAKKGK